VRFLRANVQQVDLKQRQIVTDAGPIDYDYLVLAPGSVTNYFGNSAIQQQAYDFKALDDAAARRASGLSSTGSGPPSSASRSVLSRKGFRRRRMSMRCGRSTWAPNLVRFA